MPRNFWRFLPKEPRWKQKIVRKESTDTKSNQPKALVQLGCAVFSDRWAADGESTGAEGQHFRQESMHEGGMTEDFRKIIEAFGCTVIDYQDGIYSQIGANTFLFAPFLLHEAYMTSSETASIVGRPTDNLALFIANDVEEFIDRSITNYDKDKDDLDNLPPCYLQGYLVWKQFVETMLQGTTHRYLISNKDSRALGLLQDQNGLVHETSGLDSLRIWWRPGTPTSG